MPWVWKQVIAATAWTRTPRFWIRDRDSSYGGDFQTKTAAIDIRTVLTPVRAPKANSLAERVIGTFRREYFDHVIVWNERHVRRLMAKYVQFYNEERTHRALGLELTKRLVGDVTRRDLDAQLQNEAWAGSVCREAADSDEGRAAFLEKRVPRWSGR